MSKIYIRNPWAQLIVDGKKTIETAAFNLPDRFINKWLHVQTENKMIIGKVKFTATKRYATAETFDSDTTAHCVGEGSLTISDSVSAVLDGLLVPLWLSKPQKKPPPLNHSLDWSNEMELILHALTVIALAIIFYAIITGDS
jgi:hypothetical protein